MPAPQEDQLTGYLRVAPRYLAATVLTPERGLIFWVSGAALVFLALLVVIAARAGGAGVLAGAWRVTFWDELAMAITAGVASLFGGVV